MKRLIILVALIFTTTAQADWDWYKNNKDLGLELNKSNLKTTTRMAKLEARKCLRFLQYTDPHTMEGEEITAYMADWKEKCYASRLVNNQILNWYDAEESKYIDIYNELQNELLFRQDTRELMDLSNAITNKMKLNNTLISSQL